MLLELLHHLISFDFAWIAQLVLNNLHWVFALFLFTYMANKGEKPIWHFLVIVGMLYAAVDIAGLANWLFVPLLIFIPLNLLIFTFFEGTSLEKHSIKIIVVLFFLFTFIHTFYFRFPGV